MLLPYTCYVHGPPHSHANVQGAVIVMKRDVSEAAGTLSLSLFQVLLEYAGISRVQGFHR